MRKFNIREAVRLYAVTDRTWLQGTLYETVAQALEGGATFLQLRDKKPGTAHNFYEIGQLQALCLKHAVPFVINDDVKLALSCDADGVHVGQSDMSARKARRLLGPDKILGVSVRTVEQALAAEEAGADYIGVGAVFSTATKKDAENVSFEALRQICATVKIPVVAIGGISLENMSSLKGSGIEGVAVVSAIFAAENIFDATKALRSEAEEVCS